MGAASGARRRMTAPSISRGASLPDRGAGGPAMSRARLRRVHGRLCARHADEIGDTRQDVVTPELSMERAEMAGLRMEIMRVLLRRDIAAQGMGDLGLAHARDIVMAAFDGQQRGATDRQGVDRDTPPGQSAARQRRLLEGKADRVEDELRRQIHYRQILFGEGMS